MSTPLKLFISYCHLDEKYINNFIKQIEPLKDMNLIEDWYDRKILAGGIFQDDIDNNLENADIICLFISANFLSSNACKKEINTSINLQNIKNITIIPIILEHCGWLDNIELKKILATPTDAKPISTFIDESEAWQIVYQDIKKNIININNKFLKNTELHNHSYHEKSSKFFYNNQQSEILNIYQELWEKVDTMLDSTAKLVHLYTTKYEESDENYVSHAESSIENTLEYVRKNRLKLSSKYIYELITDLTKMCISHTQSFRACIDVKLNKRKEYCHYLAQKSIKEEISEMIDINNKLYKTLSELFNKYN